MLADEETTQRRYERVVGAVTLIATLAAAGFAGGAYVQAKRQGDIAQEALIESDHPFLQLSAKSNPDIVRAGEAYISVSLKLTNVGSKVAMLDRAEFALADDSNLAPTVASVTRPGLINLAWF